MMHKNIFQTLFGSRKKETEAKEATAVTKQPVSDKSEQESDVPQTVSEETELTKVQDEPVQQDDADLQQVNEDVDTSEMDEYFTSLKKCALDTSNENTYHVAVIGEVGNGKTTLLAAILKLLSQYGLAEEIDYSTLNQEKSYYKNGIMFSSTTIEFNMKNHHLIFTEFSDYEDWFKEAVCHHKDYDMALLVANATRDSGGRNFAICTDAHIPNMTVFMNKKELVTIPDLFDLSINYYSDQLDCCYYQSPIFKGSAKKALQGSLTEQMEIFNLLKWIDEQTKKESDESGYPEPIGLFNCQLYMLSESETGTFTTFNEDDGCTIQIGDQKCECTVANECHSGELYRNMIELCPDDMQPKIIVNRNEVVSFTLLQEEKTIALGYITKILC